MIPKHPLRGMREHHLCTLPDTKLSVCAYFPRKKKVLFITQPVQHRDVKHAIFGMLDVENNALSSILTEWHPTKTVVSTALCDEGLLSCSETGLVMVNFTTGKCEILVRSSPDNQFDRFMGVAVHPDGSFWFTFLNPERRTYSKIYRRMGTQILETLRDGNHKPVRIAFSPDGLKCYMACSVEKAIFMFDIDKDYKLQSCRRISYGAIENLTSLKVDREGFVFASCGRVLKCWDADGNSSDSMEMSDTIYDFTFSPRGIIVMFEGSWVLIERDPESTVANREKRRHSHEESRFSRL